MHWELSTSRGSAVEAIVPAFNITVGADGFLECGTVRGSPRAVDPGIVFTYSGNCCRGSEACRWSRWNMGSISSSGRKGSAIIFLINECVPRSWVYDDWRPSSCTCSMDKKKTFGYWFHFYGVLISNKFIDLTLLIGCEHQMPTAADLYVSSQEPVWNVVFPYIEVKVCWILWSQALSVSVGNSGYVFRLRQTRAGVVLQVLLKGPLPQWRMLVWKYRLLLWPWLLL